MQRLNAYIDGFNLYFGIRARRWPRFLWLDIEQLVRNLLEPTQSINAVHYFTARVSGTPADPDKPKRQNVYLEALQEHSHVSVHYGHYLNKKRTCFRCGSWWTDHEEKGTDVNIATEMLMACFRDEFDTALLVSADSDLAGPVRTILREFPHKRVVVAFPPKRYSAELERWASGSFHIGRAKLAASQLPERIAKADGHILERPPSWR